MKKTIEKTLQDSIEVKQNILANSVDTIIDIAEQVSASLENNGKLIIFGNGGSAADAQHIAAEFIGRFQKERPPLAAIALSTNTSVLTALGNDYGYETIFKKQLQALGNNNDIVLAISTSGKAKNVIAAANYAKSKGIKTIAFTGGSGGELAKACDISFIVPSNITARIQEAHITVAHIICELVEKALC